MDQAQEGWDKTTDTLVGFAQRSSYASLSPEVVHAVKLRVIDCFASALGAYDNPTSELARKVAARSRTDHPSTVWGSNLQTTPEAAAFANGVMTRVLDISDTYLGKSRGHPSDMISGILAVAESVRADGKAVINAITLAYDVYCSFCDAIDVNSKGWDQPVYGVLGCVLGIAHVLSLTREQTANAVAMALAPNMSLAQARRGNLSNWKGCAGANASRNAVFAAQLAQDGFTGPTAVFEGHGGLWEVIGRHDWPLPSGTHLITQTHLKCLPICYHGQSAVFAALDLRKQVAVSDIDAVMVDGYKAAHMMMGNDPTRWAPATRETADHSMPYVVAAALLDGAVTDASFTPAKMTDPAMAAMMAKIKMQSDAGLEKFYPEGAPARVNIRTKAGQTLSKEVIYPRGHAKNPLPEPDVLAKFHEFTAPRLDAARRSELINTLLNLDQVDDIAAVIRRLAA